MAITSRAVVLSGGGAAGGAWMLGILSALREEGLDLGDADLIVGTSAGARVAAALGTGVLREAAQQCRDGLPATWVPATLGQFMGASMRIIADSPTEVEAARRIANMGPLGDRLASGADRRRAIAAQLPVQEWPWQRLVITAVDAESGRRASFDAASRVGLVDAVTASGALPGIYPLVSINGRRFADGGVHSLYNADLAAGHDVVTVLSPMPLNEYFRAKLEAEVAALGAAEVQIVIADERSLAAVGPDPNSAAAARAALEAGAAQARLEIARLKPVWQATDADAPRVA
ncbi:MAG TPA: patatin-like phospholipase family protein [Streptosporangiaceae bacterium]|nr:patatin-like phospholipase family protein [Streptosporangiaceae bacterium]